MLEELHILRTYIYELLSYILCQNFLNHLKFFGSDYFKEIPHDPNDDESVKEAEKSVKLLINQYYKFMSYKTFYRKVLGERIIEKKTIDNKEQKTYVRNSSY